MSNALDTAQRMWMRALKAREKFGEGSEEVAEADGNLTDALFRERIVAAAVRIKSFFNDHVLVFQVSPPGRHCDLMVVGDPQAEMRMEQGFVTSTGRFVDRHEAWKIAFAAGQVKGDPACDVGRSLFSEDVW